MRPLVLRFLGTALFFVSAVGLPIPVVSPALAQEAATPAKAAPAADTDD
jgi:hypothetical protein